MRYILVGIFAVALVAGCSTKYFNRAGKSHEVLLNADLSIAIQMPNQNGWRVFQDSVIAEKERPSRPYLYDPSYRYAPDIIARISITRYLSQSKISIDFYDYPSRNPKGETMLAPTVLASLEEEQKNCLMSGTLNSTRKPTPSAANIGLIMCMG